MSDDPTLVRAGPVLAEGSGMFSKLMIVIPTRNRADMACRAAISVMEVNAMEDVGLLISDNSTEAGESAIIDEFGASHPSPNLKIIRPPSPLSMTRHWQWAIEQAMVDGSASHFFFLTDRMLFKKDALLDLVRFLKAYPATLVSFSYDRIDDYSRPVTFLPLPRSGLAYRISSTTLLDLSARMIFYSCLPRMLNSAAPRALLEAIRTSYSTVFASISPDFCFCYRALALTDTILYLDESLLVNYGADRSNGASNARGLPTKDSSDFLKALEGQRLNENSPIPQILTIGNAIVHEYQSVSASQSVAHFPTLNRDAYLDFLAREVSLFVDARDREMSRRILYENGWIGKKTKLVDAISRFLLELALSLRRKSFPDVATAIHYAITHRVRHMNWLGVVHRRYGKNIVRQTRGRSHSH